MSNRGNKGYIPWHERVDERLIQDLCRQFVIRMFHQGVRVSELTVKWEEDGHTFTATPHGTNVDD